MVIHAVNAVMLSLTYCNVLPNANLAIVWGQPVGAHQPLQDSSSTFDDEYAMRCLLLALVLLHCHHA